MTQEVKLKRSQCNYQAETARFLLECDFSKQYSHYYRKRFEKTRPFLEFNCRQKWDANIPIYSLSQLADAIPFEDFPDGPNSDISSQVRPRRFSLSLSPDIPDSANSSYEFTKRLRSSQLEPTSPEPFKFVSSTQTNASSSRKPSPISEPLESPILAPKVEPTVNNNLDVCGSRGFCIIVGTIFKRMKMQPDVVEELSRGNFHVKCERYLGHYVSPDDRLVLEDIEESIALTGNIRASEFVTGVVVALLGRPIEDCARFEVKDICYAEPNSQLLYDDTSGIIPDIGTQPIERPLVSAEPLYLLVISSLGFSHNMAKQSNLTVALQSLIDFVWGGDKYADDSRSSKISRVLIVGDNLSADRSDTDRDSPINNQLVLAGPSTSRSREKDEIAIKVRESRQVKPYTESVQAIKHLDDFFAELSKTIPVDVMPGYSDPSSHLMPQQPFHPCMFPKSCMFTTFNCTTNPYHAIYDDHVEVLATSGQNVDIVSKFSSISNPIEVMGKHLLWGSSAPSAPDNLYSVPYEEEDPYVIDFIPDIYIAGCQEYYRAENYFYTNASCLDDTIRSDETLVEVKEESKTPTCSPGITGCTKSVAQNRGANNPWQPRKKDRTLLITVPRFCETFTCVLINLKNLESQLVSFECF